MRRIRTASVFNANFGTAVDQVLDDFGTAALDGSRQWRRAVQRRRLELGAVLQEILDDALDAGVCGVVQRSPPEVVFGVYVGAVRHRVQARLNAHIA